MSNYDYEESLIRKVVKVILSCKTSYQLQTATSFMRLAEKRIQSRWPREAIADQFGLDMILIINQLLINNYEKQNSTNN